MNRQSRLFRWAAIFWGLAFVCNLIVFVLLVAGSIR